MCFRLLGLNGTAVNKYTFDGFYLKSGRGVHKTHHIELHLEHLGRYTGK